MKTRVGVWIDHRQIAAKVRQYFQAEQSAGVQTTALPRCANSCREVLSPVFRKP